MEIQFNKKDIVVERSYKTVYKKGNSIYKVFEPEHPKTGIFNEALITSYVESYGVAAPAVRSVQQIDGKWALEIEYVEGETLAEKMAGDTDKWLEAFVDVQMRVNAYKADGLRNTVDKRIEEIQALPDLDPSARYELLQRLHGMKRHTKLCHGDFVPENVIVTPDGEYRVVDWAHATQGNAGADAALSYLHFRLQKSDDLAEDYLKLYSKKSDTAIQYIQKWMPIVAAAQMKNADDLTKEFLENWVNVVEYQ